MYIQRASVNRAILQHCFFWFGNTGAFASITILLPTLKCFTFNGAVDWSKSTFAMKAFYRNGDSFVTSNVNFEKIRGSSQSCCSIGPCHQDLSSKLRGYWLYTKEERR